MGRNLRDFHQRALKRCATLVLRGVLVRPLPLMVGLSMVATGLLGFLSFERAAPERATPLSAVSVVPLGSRVVVRGLIENLSAAGGAAAVGTITDCAGVRVAVFFPRGASPAWRYTLVTMEGTIHEYRGARELVVDDPAYLRMDVQGALAVTPDEIMAHGPDLVCREVGFTGRVAWAAVAPDDSKAVHVAVEAASGELMVVIHVAHTPALRVQPGASVTFLGTVTIPPNEGRPVVHVRA
jgi:hypothetical protein